MTHAAAVRPLRLWPGAVLVTLQWVLWIIAPRVVPEQGGIGLLGGMVAGVLVLLWWLFFSRAPWVERLGTLVVAVAGVLAAKPLLDISVTTALMGYGRYVLSIPHVCLGIVAGAALGRGMSAPVRRSVLVVTALLGALSLGLVRVEGVTGAGAANITWRWTQTAEERLLAQVRDEPPPPPAAAGTPVVSTPDKPVDTKPADPAPAAPPAAAAPALSGEWPGFRGARRDGVIRGAKIATDWSRTPPKELWRRPIGPGWSSFAVAGDLVYTQEQRGEQEVVSAYRLATGEPVWRHRDNVRFYEANAGAGPRATPAVHDGRVFTQGAKGTVNALDARTGAVIWTRDAQADTGATMPGWGYTGSPQVVDGLVIVSASGRLVAYEVATGTPRWTQKTVGGGYSSPQFVTIDGVPQILMLSSGGGITSVAPSDGTVLWQSAWQEGVSIIQPSLLTDGVLAATGDSMGGQGIRRLAVSKAGDGWKVEERWTTRGLKPYFSDFVVHKGHAFGFDGTILSAINLETGERVWKGGRYGAGQMMLLADQDLLLVLSEEGELALVSATPDKHTEVARFKAIEGKTWNHPVLVGDVVLVRNGDEMAAFKLAR